MKIRVTKTETRVFDSEKLSIGENPNNRKYGALLIEEIEKNNDLWKTGEPEYYTKLEIDPEPLSPEWCCIRSGFKGLIHYADHLMFASFENLRKMQVFTNIDELTRIFDVDIECRSDLKDLNLNDIDILFKENLDDIDKYLSKTDKAYIETELGGIFNKKGQEFAVKQAIRNVNLDRLKSAFFLDFTNEIKVDRDLIPTQELRDRFKAFYTITCKREYDLDSSLLDVLNMDTEYQCQILDRCRSDCEYYLNHPTEHMNWWAGDQDTQIEFMYALYDSFPWNYKPEWLSMRDIDRYVDKFDEMDMLADEIEGKSPLEIFRDYTNEHEQDFVDSADHGDKKEQFLDDCEKFGMITATFALYGISNLENNATSLISGSKENLSLSERANLAKDVSLAQVKNLNVNELSKEII